MPPTPTIDYARKHPSSTRNAILRLTLLLILSAALISLAFLYTQGPTGCQVRLDSGDLRYTFLGIPIHYRQLPTPEPTALLTLAKSAGIPPEWQWINFGGRSNPDLMCQYEYGRIADWFPTDPAIARFAFEDNVSYIRASHWNGGLPKSVQVTFSVRPNPAGKLTVEPHWKSDPSVRAFCRTHAYPLLP